MDYLSNSWNHARKLAEEHWLRQTHDPSCRFYVYYRASVPGVPGEVKILREDELATEGFVLAAQESIPRNRTKDGVVAWLQPVIHGLPILPI